MIAWVFICWNSWGSWGRSY